MLEKMYFLYFLICIFTIEINSEINVIRGQNLTTIKPCKGFEDATIQLISGSFTNTIKVPGTAVINFKANISVDLPKDIIIKIYLVKKYPVPLEVPCIQGLGACEYDGCNMIEFNDDICKGFPPNVPCACPMQAGAYNFKEVEIAVPDFGIILGSLMEGEYDAKMTVYGKATSASILGCFEAYFELVNAHTHTMDEV